MSWRPNRLQRRLGIKPDPLRLNQPSQPPPPLATEAESEFDVTISFLNDSSNLQSFNHTFYANNSFLNINTVLLK